MRKSKKKKTTLVSSAPRLDEETRRRRRALAELEQLSPEELHAFMIRVGIFTADGELAPQYRDDAEPSACRPTD